MTSIIEVKTADIENEIKKKTEHDKTIFKVTN